MLDLEEGMDIKAGATVEKLAQAVAKLFDKNGLRSPNVKLPRVLLVMHKWYVPTEKLVTIFANQYRDAGAETMEAKRQRAEKASIAALVRYWTDEFPEHFEFNLPAKKALEDLEEMVKSDGFRERRFNSRSSSFGSTGSSNTLFPPGSPGPFTKKSRGRTSFAFQNINAEDLAEQLTMIDVEVFKQIPFEEWASYGKHAKPVDCPKLQEAVSLFNGISRWIQARVLSERTPSERAKSMSHFIAVAQHLRNLDNFNTLVAVVGGLNSSALSRLKQTRQELSKNDKKLLKSLQDDVSSDGNYSHYRKELSSLSPYKFAFPVIGIILKDLVAIHASFKDRNESGHINVHKLTQLYQQFEHIKKYQNLNPRFLGVPELLNILRVSLQPRFAEEELYELSLMREARSARSSSVEFLDDLREHSLFGDWAAGVDVNVNEAVLKKHISFMVDAVFRAYDTDKNGCISMEEFSELSTHFPFIDSFAALDSNNDGVISRSEMRDYFYQANLPLLRKSFNHTFQETTFFAPTYCNHCDGWLWGLLKQGFKCKECGINCHRHCKDLVVVECRKEKDGALGTPTLKRRKSSRHPSINAAVVANPGVLNNRATSPLQERLAKLEGEHVKVVTEKSQLALELALTKSELKDCQAELEEMKTKMDTVRQETIDYVLRHLHEPFPGSEV
eukprot:m.19792 g.19792  ORF g.19792 m.19792 type:complete len:673 (+) comp27907_c0_seq1:228-2246(+)